VWISAITRPASKHSSGGGWHNPDLEKVTGSTRTLSCPGRTRTRDELAKTGFERFRVNMDTSIPSARASRSSATAWMSREAESWRAVRRGLALSGNAWRRVRACPCSFLTGRSCTTWRFPYGRGTSFVSELVAAAVAIILRARTSLHRRSKNGRHGARSNHRVHARERFRPVQAQYLADCSSFFASACGDRIISYGVACAASGPRGPKSRQTRLLLYHDSTWVEDHGRRLESQSVSFAYEPESPVLADAMWAVNGGEVMALSGRMVGEKAPSGGALGFLRLPEATCC
jgi:hypothetical protein